MIKLNLQMFGGRGGTASSARWMNGFFKSVKRSVDSDSKDAYDLDASKMIYNKLTKATNEDKVNPRDGYDPIIEGRVLKEWARNSKTVKYNEDESKIKIEPGKLGEARREFERFTKNKFRKYYRRGTALKKK